MTICTFKNILFIFHASVYLIQNTIELTILYLNGIRFDNKQRKTAINSDLKGLDEKNLEKINTKNWI